MSLMFYDPYNITITFWLKPITKHREKNLYSNKQEQLLEEFLK